MQYFLRVIASLAVCLLCSGVVQAQSAEAPPPLRNAAGDAESQASEKAIRAQELWGLDAGRWRLVPHLDATLVGIADRHPLGLPPDNMQLLVTRLWPGLEVRSRMFRAVLQLQNFRLRSSEKLFRAHTFNVFQAFIQLSSRQVIARLGRQVVPLDDLRLLDQAVFRSGVFFDGLLLRLQFPKTTAMFFGGMRNSLRLANEDKNNASGLGIARLSWQADKLLAVNPFVLYRYDAASINVAQGRTIFQGARSIVAPGIALHIGDKRRWAKLMAAGQFGYDGELPHRAYAFAARLSYTAQRPLLPGIELGSLIASGAADDGSVSEFDSFYLNPWLRHGYAGAFSLRNVAQGWAKTQITARVFGKQLLNFEVGGYLFGLADPNARWVGAFGFPLAAPSEGARRFVGSELDLVLTYIPLRWMVLRLVYAGFFPGIGAYDRGIDGPQHRGIGIMQLHF